MKETVGSTIFVTQGFGDVTVSMHLLDVLGREVVRPISAQVMEKGDNAVQLDFSTLPTGMYQCRIFTGNNVYTIPIIHYN